MDPNVTLREMRDTANLILGGVENGDVHDAGADLAEYVLALDDWLCKAGFMPDAWARGPETLADRVRAKKPVKCDWGGCGRKATETFTMGTETRPFCERCGELNRQCIRLAIPKEHAHG